MSYSYNFDDNNSAVTSGMNNTMTYGGVLQRPDAWGGYNVMFGLVGSSAYYHVHFARGGTRVTAVRYFSGNGGQGDNIIQHFGGGATKTLSNLANECVGFNNHQALLNNLKNTVANVGRTVAQELQ